MHIHKYRRGSVFSTSKPTQSQFSILLLDIKEDIFRMSINSHEETSVTCPA